MTGRYAEKEPVLYANDTPVEGPSQQLAGMLGEARAMQMELLDQLHSLLYSISGSPCEKPELQESKCMMQDAAQLLKIAREALMAVETLRKVTGC